MYMYVACSDQKDWRHARWCSRLHKRPYTTTRLRPGQGPLALQAGGQRDPGPVNFLQHAAAAAQPAPAYRREGGARTD